MRFCKGPNQHADEQDTGARTEATQHVVNWLYSKRRMGYHRTRGPGSACHINSVPGRVLHTGMSPCQRF